MSKAECRREDEDFGALHLGRTRGEQAGKFWCFIRRGIFVFLNKRGWFCSYRLAEFHRSSKTENQQKMD